MKAAMHAVGPQPQTFEPLGRDRPKIGRQPAAADTLLKRAELVQVEQQLGIGLIDRYAGLYHVGPEIPVAIGRRRDAILVEAIGVCAGDDGLVPLVHEIAKQGKRARRGAADIDDLDTFHGLSARTADIDDPDIGGARRVAGDDEAIGR
jgi:hypothetical protein